MSEIFWQPVLEGPTCLLRPLRPDDFDALFRAASDPAVWEQHPVPDRYKREKFVQFFEGALKSGGALVVVRRDSGELVGTSRFTDFDEGKSTVEIGYTFLAKSQWGTGLNAEVKGLMIRHALLRAHRIFFYVGAGNLRSQRALEKLGIPKLDVIREVEVDGRLITSFIYEVNRDNWPVLSGEGAPLSLGALDRLSPVRRALLDEVCDALLTSEANPVLRVAVDGVDGAGKTTFADELGSALTKRGRQVIRASVDGFHNPRAVRYRRGRDSPEGFFEDSYDYAKFLELLVHPLSPGGSLRFKRAAFDHRTDSAVNMPEEQASPGAILLVDGIFLHRDELVPFWDFSVFLETSFASSYARMAQRDGCPPEPFHPRNRRYFEGQRLYMHLCNPKTRATLVINNDVLSQPFIVKAQHFQVTEAAP